MTPTEARTIKLKTRVEWESSHELGTVTEKGEAGIRVHWDDGTDAVYLYTQTISGLKHVQKVAR